MGRIVLICDLVLLFSLLQGKIPGRRDEGLYMVVAGEKEKENCSCGVWGGVTEKQEAEEREEARETGQLVLEE